MSWNPLLDPDTPTGDGVDAIEMVIVPRARDLGDFEVRRALPAPRRQMVGPFIFFDQMGPAEFITGQGVDIRPHPHIGLATVTYLYEGRFHHRDSLGTDQWIEPGAVNLEHFLARMRLRSLPLTFGSNANSATRASMIPGNALMNAGYGITHSERVDGEILKQPYRMSGIQTWIALPKDAEDNAPDFAHAGKDALPVLDGKGKTLRLILGQAYGARAPVATPSEMFYADAALQPGASLPMPDDHEDRGAYVVDGSVTIAGDTFDKGRMMVFRPGDAVSMKAGPKGARVMLLGGATLEGPRHIWWNFVASSKERIEAAKEAWRQGDWQHGRFQLPPTDRDEFIPLPGR